ncbi:MAG: nuclear transport factor 2 family protein [Actinomycetota bacterium]
MSQENVELVRRSYEAFNRWGVHPRGARNPEIPPFLHPEVAFHTYASAPEAGVYRGREAVIEYHQRVFGQFESVRVELEELLSAGDRVVIISRQHTVPSGSEAEIVQQVVEVWTIRDGLLAERKAFSTRAEALEAAGLRE